MKTKKNTATPIQLDKSLCIGCTMCVQVCPSYVLTMNETTQKAQIINPSACTQCAFCIDACAYGAIKLSFY